jgi:hypothetical protein
MDNLKTAQELKAIADSYSKSSVIIENIIALALDAANKGEYCVSYEEDGFQCHYLDDTCKDIIEKLTKLGYSCWHAKTKLQFGAQSYLSVSWR